MSTSIVDPAADLSLASASILRHYRSVPSRETETAIALLVLWTLDALDGERITPEDATAILTRLWVGITDPPSGPDLSEATHELLEEGGMTRQSAKHRTGNGCGLSRMPCSTPQTPTVERTSDPRPQDQDSAPALPGLLDLRG